jgi:hypothetical protein
MRIHDEPPNNSEPEPGEQEVEGEHKESPSPLSVHKRREDVLQVAPAPLGHLSLHNVAVAVLEHYPLPDPPRTEPGLPVPACRHNTITSEPSSNSLINIVNKNTQTLLDASKEVGLGINAEKTKYVFMFHQENTGQNHNINITDYL